MDLGEHREQLIARASACEGVTSLVFFGSATTAAQGRRDVWSDLDFNLFATAEAVEAVRCNWPFLPFPSRLVLTAREGADGGVAIYDDGTVYEFGVGLPWDIRDPAREVVLDGGDLRLAGPPDHPDAANEIRLFLTKLYLGVGRVRRGEVLSGSTLIRTVALTHLCAAIRGRLAPAGPDEPSAFDPTRRMESAYPQIGRRLAAALDHPAEDAARLMLDIAREELEPNWAQFPTAATALVAARLGWA
jgi:hypothetical protein